MKQCFENASKSLLTLILCLCITLPVFAQLELTQIQFQEPRTVSSNPSNTVEYEGKVLQLIRDAIIVWDLESATWEKKEVTVQTGNNLSSIEVINNKIVTFPDYLNDVENNIYGREPAILDSSTFELRGIRDINPNGSSFDRHLLTHNGRIYFLANDGLNGKEVWVTDGTYEGTLMLYDMTPGVGGQSNIWAVPFLDKVIINYNRQLFWITDGTPSGTGVLKDFGEYIPGLPITSDQFQIIGSNCYFVVSTTPSGNTIWKTDGTPEGTLEFTDFSSFEFSTTPKIIALNGELFSFGWESSVVNYPFIILNVDLTSGEMEEMVYQEALGSLTGIPTVIDDYIYYAIYGNSATSGIYRFDGSVDGAESLKIISDLIWAVGSPIASDGGFYWGIKTASSGQELWYSEHTEESTVLVKDIDRGVYGGLNTIKGVFQNTLFFSANSGATGIEPWVSKGTEETTFQIDDFGTSLEDIQLINMKVADNNLYVNMNSGTARPNLFRLIDNKLVDVINQPSFQGRTYFDIEAFQEKIYFGSIPDFQTLYPKDYLYHLFSVDGTEIESIKSMSTAGPREFSVANDVLFFVAGNPSTGNEYWISNGSSDGTKMLKDINPGSANGYANWLGFSELSGVIYLDGTYYFSAIGPGQGHELWKTDLTEPGTLLVKDINPGTGDSYPYNFTSIDTKVFFTATDNGANYGSWVSDGTEDGTIKLINQLGAAFYKVGEQIYITTREFIEETNKNLFKIWKTDGTLAGTSEFRTLGEFQQIEPPVAQVPAGVFFGENLGETWSYNLLTESQQIVPILPEQRFGLSDLFKDGPNVYLVTPSQRIWVSDGSVDGTSELEIDLPASSQLSQHWTRFGDDLVFGSGNFSLWSLNLFKARFEINVDGQRVSQEETITVQSAVGGNKSLDLEIVNSGYANLELTGSPKVDISGSGADDFSVTVNPSDAIGINKNTTVSIKFEPTSTGLKEAIVTIEMNDGRDNIILYLQGTGEKSLPVINFVELAPKSIADEPFDLSATTNSNKEISFTSSDSEVASISGKTVTIHKSGMVTITATVQESGLYQATTKQQVLIINKATQSITFDPLPSKTYGDDSFELTATASSGLVITFSSSDPAVATIVDFLVTINKAGSAVITAIQAGNNNYASVSKTQTLTINKASQSITFNTLPEKTYGDPSFELSSTTSTGLPATFTSSNPAVVTIEAREATILGAGLATITASQDGNDNYLPASADQTITVNKATQSITFDELPTLEADDAPFELTASATSGLPVSFVSQNESIAVVTGNTLTVVGAGETTMSALQQGNDNYLAAEEVVRTLVVEEVTGLVDGLADSIIVYPNPASNVLLVTLPPNFPEVNYTLTQLAGHVLKYGQLMVRGSIGQVSIEGLRPGIYLFTIVANGSTRVFRVIKT